MKEPTRSQLMKLSKLYSNHKDFKNIAFNLSGINVVYADVITEARDKKNSHDLGKTKLAELIDFLLLKEIDKKHFLLKVKDENEASVFNTHIFYLEIKINSGEYVTIRRGVQQNTKISFAVNDQSTEDFIPPTIWDHEDIPIKKAKLQLTDYLNFDFFKNKTYNYRKAISYSLRMQGDYEDVYKLSKYVGGADIDWKPFMFDLIGFDGSLLEAKYENDDQRDKIKTLTEQLKTEYSVKVEERDDIVAQIKIIETKYRDAEKQIDTFNFFEKDKELATKGIDELENRISELNTLAYELEYEIERLEKSLQNRFSFDLNKVQQVFEESKIYFSQELKADYEALLNFNKRLTIERNRMIKDALKQKREEFKNVSSTLQRLNEEKSTLLSYLTDTDAFKKFKFYQKELVKVESQSVQLKEKLKIIDKIIEKDKERDELLKKIEDTVIRLKDVYQHTENNEKYSDIREKFSIFYKEIMDEDVRISWNINANNNVDFIPPKVQSKGDHKKDTAKDEGKTYKKMLCVAFDLAILCSYNNESYFRFVYHDDVLSQQDNGIKMRLLHLLEELTANFDLQYVLSVIKSDLPVDDRDNPVYFNEDLVILKLHDRDESGTLFGFEF